jgi:hypothetical protein
MKLIFRASKLRAKIFEQLNIQAESACTAQAGSFRERKANARQDMLRDRLNRIDGIVMRFLNPNLVKEWEVLNENIKLTEAYIKKTDNIPSYYCTKHKDRLREYISRREEIRKLIY